jgi:hypothetical protein
MSRTYPIDCETADKITLDVLVDHRNYLTKELKEYEEGHWLHPEDVVKNQTLVQALDEIILYFGG